MEPNGVCFAPTGKLRALDLIEAIVCKEHRGRGEAAARPCDAELPTINPVDAVRDVDLQLAALREPLEGIDELDPLRRALIGRGSRPGRGRQRWQECLI